MSRLLPFGIADSEGPVEIAEYSGPCSVVRLEARNLGSPRSAMTY
jgi:hypothetical protein